jgi:hypothetical protein
MESSAVEKEKRLLSRFKPFFNPGEENIRKKGISFRFGKFRLHVDDLYLR